jgi:tetratricopeptide (TPR) repeat protein
MCLDDQHKHQAAERACRKAIDLRPDWAAAHYCLGNTLARQKNHAVAEKAFRKVIGLRPDWAAAHYNLGNALTGQGKPGAAEAAYRQAIALRPDFALAHNNLGLTLIQQQKPGGEPAFRQAIALRPDFALAHLNLADTLREQARFDEALVFATRGNDLLPAGDPLCERARPLILQCQRQVALDARLPAILRGAEKPANAAEQIDFAKLCALKKLHAAAARFYGGAFTAEPKFADDVWGGARYNAACAAALAGCGQGKDADKLDETERARLRRQALDWLREDLTWWARKLENGTAQASASIRQWLQHWQSDPDLAGVRSRDALARLPAKERQQWERLWSDVEALLRRVSRPE